jgi:hypothetical protein
MKFLIFSGREFDKFWQYGIEVAQRILGYPLPEGVF